MVEKENKLMENNIYLKNSFNNLQQNPTLPCRSLGYYGPNIKTQ